MLHNVTDTILISMYSNVTSMPEKQILCVFRNCKLSIFLLSSNIIEQYEFSYECPKRKLDSYQKRAYAAISFFVNSKTF
jgi:hypothetical protein